MNSNLQKEKNGFSHSVTSSCTIRWEISDVSPTPHNEQSLESPHFAFQNATWCLRIDTTDPVNNLPGRVSLNLVRIKSFVPHHELNCNVVLKDSVVTIYNCPVTRKFYDQIEEMQFLHHLNTMKLLKLGKYTIECLLSSEGEANSSFDASFQAELLFQDMKDIGALRQNFKDLLVNGQGHDVTLKVRDKELRAHRNILRSRSRVLKSMLSRRIETRSSSVIDINDCDPEAYEQFLLYLYSGTVEKLDAGNMLALYYIADKYDAVYLMEKCRVFIRYSLSPACVCDVIQLALNHGDNDLLQSAADYFVRNVNEILPTVEWQSFVQSNGLQANELFMKAASLWHSGNA